MGTGIAGSRARSGSCAGTRMGTGCGSSLGFQIRFCLPVSMKTSSTVQLSGVSQEAKVYQRSLGQDILVYRNHFGSPVFANASAMAGEYRSSDQLIPV